MGRMQKMAFIPVDSLISIHVTPFAEEEHTSSCTLRACEVRYSDKLSLYKLPAKIYLADAGQEFDPFIMCQQEIKI
jgi:hypothetical protein